MGHAHHCVSISRHNSSEPLQLGSFQTIMIGHNSPKFYLNWAHIRQG